MDKGAFVSLEKAESITLAEARDRYAVAVTAKKKGRRQEESRIRLWKNHPLARCSLA